MAPTNNVPNPVRTLITLFAILGVLTGVMFLQGETTPKLGLDLAGGTTVTMKAQTEAGKTPPDDQMNEAINIIRNRVNGSGLTDAEVTKQGANVIVVSVPGDPKDQAKLIDLVRTTAQLQFRQVFVEEQTVPSDQAVPTVAPSGTPTPSGTATTKPAVSPSPTAKNRPLSQALAAAPSPSAAPSSSTSPAAAPSTPTAAEQDAAQFAKVTDKAVIAKFRETTCSSKGTKVDGSADAAKAFIVACDEEGTSKYILGPVRVLGTEVNEANVQSPNVQAGNVGWEVSLNFNGKGKQQFGEVTTEASKAYTANPADPQGQVAIVLDGQVVSAPQIRSGAILGGTASISGNFNETTSAALANKLKYGSLPLVFPPADSQVSAISSSLGADQLHGGLVAGGIGLGLVLVYSLMYYRGLGFVSVASLLVAAGITYLSVVILGKNAGFRLSLPHIIGLIVSIGITADSFIVYFERLRDELKAGRALRPSVEVSWLRARRTIIVADAVTFLAAVVLYVLAVGGVAGFAFAMGLTTLIDVIVVFFFTKPLVAVLAKTKFFAKGHKYSGLDAKRLNRTAPITRAPKRQEA
ncbi:MAG: protein translocase subunit SecD [Streptosporangiaceae bacterium]